MRAPIHLLTLPGAIIRPLAPRASLKRIIQRRRKSTIITALIHLVSELIPREKRHHPFHLLFHRTPLSLPDLDHTSLRHRDLTQLLPRSNGSESSGDRLAQGQIVGAPAPWRPGRVVLTHLRDGLGLVEAAVERVQEQGYDHFGPLGEGQGQDVGAAFGVIMAIVGVYQDDCIAGDDR